MLINHKITIAPMMEYTHRHYRYFMRLLSKHTLLYTEMVNEHLILQGDRQRFLAFNKQEHPLALQLGGSDPKALAKCSKIAEDYGYDEVNLNIGCPSDRVQAGRFGACLMKQPELVAECIAAMEQQVNIPITVKTRIGVDDHDSYEFLNKFIKTVASANCKTFIIHARKAWLKGLSPKENRTIPPLNYETVYQLKQDFPDLEIIINGGIQSTDEIKNHLTKVDGVMLGREAYHNPYLFAHMDQQFFNTTDPIKSRLQIIKDYLPYMEQELKQGTRLNHLTIHILGLFHGIPGAKAWRRYLSQHIHKANSGTEVILDAMPLLQI